MTASLVAAWMFPSLFAFVFLGLPIAFALIVTAFLFGYGLLGDNLLLQFHNRIVDVASNYSLGAITLFVFMGSVLERTGIAGRMFEAIRMFLGPMKGGLALSTVALCAVFAASAGVVGAVEILVGMMALPAMANAGYKKDLIAGTICAGGSLGTMIPPSIVVVIYASVADIGIGDLLAAMVVPAAEMVALFILYIVVRCNIDPEAGPGIDKASIGLTLPQKLWFLLVAFIPAILLMIGVLGSIFAGIAAPTEAAAVGALGALILAVVYRQLNMQVLYEALKRTVTVSAMVIFIIAGGTMFSSVFLLNGGNTLVRDLIATFELTPTMILVLFLSILFVLGFVLDWISIVLIAVPIFAPVIKAVGLDPVWVGVLACIMLQTSYLTPPMAPSIFYLRAIAPPDMTYMDMYRGVIPFILLQVVTLVTVIAFPQSATWLPDVLFGF